MNLALKTPGAAPCKSGKDLNVLVLCEDSATVERACDVLHLLWKNFNEEDGRLFYQWWNLEFLAVMELQEMFAGETAAADMIIMGVHGGRELPERIGTWMKQWPDLRKDRPGALVAVLDADVKAPDGAEGMLSQLKAAAAAGHMDFFATRAKEVRDAGMKQELSEVARQFVMARHPVLHTDCRAENSRRV